MHDVGVSLHLHELRHLDGARRADAAQVVAGQVDEHQVLGPFLRVGQELPLERRVLRRAPPASPRAGQGPDDRPSVARLHVHLGGSPEELEVLEVEIEHVR